MEINFHTHVGSVGRTPATKPVASQAPSEQDQVTLETTRALRRSLEESPDVRPEKVEHAARLVGDVNYPPPEMLQKISHLLALRLQSEKALSD